MAIKSSLVKARTWPTTRPMEPTKPAVARRATSIHSHAADSNTGRCRSLDQQPAWLRSWVKCQVVRRAELGELRSLLQHLLDGASLLCRTRKRRRRTMRRKRTRKKKEREKEKAKKGEEAFFPSEQSVISFSGENVCGSMRRPITQITAKKNYNLSIKPRERRQQFEYK